MDQKLQKIAQSTKKRYSKRYAELGYHVRTLGWGSTEQQEYRFMQTLMGKIDLSGKHVLDIGCGFGDYLDFLEDRDVNVKSYTGWDINPDLIKEARKRHAKCKKAEFRVVDITNPDHTAANQFDICIMLGLLNFNLKSDYDNVAFSKMAMANAFTQTKGVLILDFLSSFKDKSYPPEDFVFYHNPGDMLNHALTLTDNVMIKHDYPSIPQKEMMLFLYKQGTHAPL